MHLHVFRTIIFCHFNHIATHEVVSDWSLPLPVNDKKKLVTDDHFISYDGYDLFHGHPRFSIYHVQDDL